MTDKKDKKPQKLNANAGLLCVEYTFYKNNLRFLVRRTQNFTIIDQGKRKFKQFGIENPVIT